MGSQQVRALHTPVLVTRGENETHAWAEVLLLPLDYFTFPLDFSQPGGTGVEPPETCQQAHPQNRFPFMSSKKRI